MVLELNEAASDEIRTLIREDKMDEARKIDPAKYPPRTLFRPGGNPGAKR